MLQTSSQNDNRSKKFVNQYFVRVFYIRLGFFLLYSPIFSVCHDEVYLSV